MIRLTEVRLNESAHRNVKAVLDSGQLAMGPMVERFERCFAELLDVEFAVAVSNGTLALVAALQAAGIGAGDEVITSPFTFVATVAAVTAVGAVPVLADIDPLDFTIEPDIVESLITQRTRAVMPVHLFGLPAQMTRLTSIAARHGLVVIEDAAQAHGARMNGQPCGTFGIGCFSFYATKNMQTGEGGMVTTTDGEIADRLRLLRNHGMRDRYVYERIGSNFRTTELAAAIGLSECERFDELTDRRRHNAAVLDAGLASIDGIMTPPVDPTRHHVYHQYTIRVEPGGPITRDLLRKHLAERGIETGVYYPKAINQYECFAALPAIAEAVCPEAERAALEVVSLPVHPYLSDVDLETIVDAVNEACRG
jgi:dTDP-4-amino-4,6-dideoxygalactose transaminase